MEENLFQKANLIARYLKGELNPNELEILNQWLAKDEQNRQLLTELEDEEKVRTDLLFLQSIDKSAAWGKIHDELAEPKSRVSIFRWAFLYWKQAAAVLLIGFLSYIAFEYTSESEGFQRFSNSSKILKNDVLPGGDKAILTLGDGSKIVLEDLKDGTFREEKGVKISKRDGQVEYDLSASVKSAEITYNTITTPVGGQYTIILPDGSRVWLNSLSSLHFPTSFTQNKREVNLTGEGYFEITKNAEQPFIVHAEKTSVEVLGTHFNVMAYPEDGDSRTTLLEGSVKVGNGSGTKVLQPGQQARTGKEIRIHEVDTEEVVAWKNGYFQFENAELKTIMHQLKRWYGIELVNEQQLPDKHFTALISRSTRLSQVLKMLEMSGELHFEINNKKVTISQEK